jgi:hypothetical protein
VYLDAIYFHVTQPRYVRSTHRTGIILLLPIADAFGVKVVSTISDSVGILGVAQTYGTFQCWIEMIFATIQFI